ncbi:hypothetical protein [Mycobacterium avium]|uniref:hypothetical protein n=1 Tax=Mycobacterium avium TaxID=1764 RepID=UPI00111C6A77|nr:hypothetical protein [Mycobacterium avium]
MGWRPNVVDGLVKKRYVKAVFGTTKSGGPKPKPGKVRTGKRQLAAAWNEFLAGHPELVSDPDFASEAYVVKRMHQKHRGDVDDLDDYEADFTDLTKYFPVKPDYNNRMRPGRSWHGDDKTRTRRPRRPRGRPSSEMQEPDGRPLRSSQAADVSIDVDKLMMDAQARREAMYEGDRLDALAVVGGDGDGDGPDLLGGGGTGHRLDGSVGEHVVFSRAKAPHRLEWCEVCAWPLPLAWKQFPCEFPDDPMPEGEFCHCNSCLSEPAWSNGRPRYCSLKCAATMDNAVDRARRRTARPDPAATFDLDGVYLAPVGRLQKSPFSWNAEPAWFQEEIGQLVRQFPTWVRTPAPAQDPADRMATAKVELGRRARRRKGTPVPVC